MKVVGAFLFLCWPVIVSACSAVRVSCNFLDERAAATIFVGTVLSPEDPETEALVHGSPIIFKVTERLRGQIGQQIAIYEPGTSCDYSFKVGESYLVVAFPDGGRLTTSELSSTQPASTAAALIRQLRALNEGRKPASLFGVLLEHSGPNATQPLAGVTIYAGGSTTRTELDGSFEFSKLLPGLFRVQAELHKPFVATESYPLLVKRGESCDAETLWTSPDGRIKGRVVDSAMKPEKGFLSVFPAGASERDSLMGFDVGKRGKFDLGPLPPGRYRLMFSEKLGSFNFYYPEKTPEQDSPAIDLGEGQHLENVMFVLR